ncbi:MAG: oligosaccharide flippase family protein, partial [Terracidiphilus sp.]
RLVLRLSFVLVVARTLGTAGMGAYTLIYTLVELLMVATGAGYADFLTREAAKDARAGWGLAFQLVWLRVGLAVPIAVVGTVALPLLHYPRPVLIGAAWMAITIIPRSLSEAVQGVLRGLNHYITYFIIELVLGGSLVAGAAVLIRGHASLELVIKVEVLAALAAGLTGLALTMKFRTRELIRMKGMLLLRKSAVFNVYGLFANVYDRFDVVLLSKLAGNYATGIYSIPYRAVGTAQIIGYGILYSLLPTLSRNVSNQVEQKRLAKATGFLLSIGYFIVLSTMIFAGPAVNLILGPQYSESANVLKVLVWAVNIRYMNFSLNTVLLAAGQERVFVRTTLVCLGVNLIGNLVLIPRFGWLAAAVMTIVTEMLLLAQNVYWIRVTVGKIVWPWEGIRTSLAFVVFFALILFGNHLRAHLLVGTVCLASYAAYLYRRGVITEFVDVWASRKSFQPSFADGSKLDVTVVRDAL